MFSLVKPLCTTFIIESFILSSIKSHLANPVMLAIVFTFQFFLSLGRILNRILQRSSLEKIKD